MAATSILEKESVTLGTGNAELKKLDVEHVRAYLTNEPGVTEYAEGTRTYEEAIVRLIDNNPWTYERVRAVMEKLIEDYENIPDVAYGAYYALCTYYRRNRLTVDYNALLNAPKSGFQQKKSFAFLKLMCKKMMAPNDWSLLEEADRLCDEAVLGYNYGVKHCFAEYVAEACENDPTMVDYFVSAYMDKAFVRVNDALKLSNGYPKFYVTRARLNCIRAFCLEKEKRDAYFKQAKCDVELAISRETDKSKQMDYRLLSVHMQSEYYERILTQAIDNQGAYYDTVLHDNIKKQEELISNQMQENNVKNLEFLSFFSAIIGLLIAGTQLMMGMEFAQGATLLVALTGCLMTAFGAIGFILHSSGKRWLVNAIVVILGIALTVLALLYGGHYAM